MLTLDVSFWPIEACRLGLQSLKCVASTECINISDEELLEEI